MNSDRSKFRVWDKRKKRYDDRYVIGDDGWAYQLSDVGDDWYDLISNEEVIIEHCTGLKDENDKLIYAYDVVRTVTGCVGVVEWIPERCGFAVHFPDDTYCAVHETQEIIGNIHEGVKK